MMTRKTLQWWTLYNFLDRPGASIPVYDLPARDVYAVILIGNEITAIMNERDRKHQRDIDRLKNKTNS